MFIAILKLVTATVIVLITIAVLPVIIFCYLLIIMPGLIYHSPSTRILVQTISVAGVFINQILSLFVNYRVLLMRLRIRTKIRLNSLRHKASSDAAPINPTRK